MDRGKTAGWQGCGRMSPSGDDPVSCPRPPHPPVAVTVGILFHAELWAGPPPPPSPALLAAGKAAGAARAAAQPPRSVRALGGGALCLPPPRISSKLNLLSAFPLPAPGVGMNGSAVNRSGAGARNRGAGADAFPSRGVPEAARFPPLPPTPCWGNLRPCARPSGSPRPRR